MKNTFTVFLLLFVSTTIHISAQDRLLQDYSQLMEIPDVIAMNASPTHLYILSKSEGLAVFRTYGESLQWLYTSEGMQQRGNKIMADIRFAYLFGDSRRLTVLEPTSVHAVYSSTVLPDKPRSAARVDNMLYIAMENSGLGFTNLETPETVDSEIQYVDSPAFANAQILDIKSSTTARQLFVLTDDPSLIIFNYDEGNLSLDSEVNFQTPLEKIFISDERVLGTTDSGEIYELHATGIANKGRISESVNDVIIWNNRFFARSESGKIHIIEASGETRIWKEDGSAGNYLVRSEDQLWISENDNVSEIYLGSETENTERLSGNFKLKPIPHRVLSYPEPLLLSLDLEEDFDASEVEFSFRSSTNNAKIRKNGFYWQPTAQQIGTHWFVIQASTSDGKSDSTRFTVEVRSFNAPPRFSPVRPASIAVDESYEVKFHAIDPENPQSTLIRYIGVDLPMGSTLNERNGQFSWKPTNRQVGESTFKIIATDKSGAAASMDVTLRVLDIARED